MATFIDSRMFDLHLLMLPSSDRCVDVVMCIIMLSSVVTDVAVILRFFSVT